MDVLLKDPASRLDVAVDWGGWLAGRAIAGAAWRVRPAGLAVVATGVEGERTVARIDGGASGRVYRLTSEVACADGSRDAREIVVRVAPR